MPLRLAGAIRYPGAHGTNCPARGPGPHPRIGDGHGAGSGTRFEDQVERGLARPAEPGESGMPDDVLNRLLARLGAQRVTAGLRLRVRDAEVGREVVVDPTDRVEVVSDVVAGHRLDDQ